MKLVKFIVIVQLSCLSQAFENSFLTDPTVAPVTEQNNTKGDLQEKFDNDPYVHPLAGRCSWTLRLPGSSSAVVPLPPESTDTLAEEICRALDCGSVFKVTKTISPPNSTCFHGCLFSGDRLQNCSVDVGSKCSVITKVVCGHHAVRLAGGPDRCAGRVELWRDGGWGTVCDDQWDLSDAQVVCAQLGCGYALNVTAQGGSFAPGRGPIHLDELNCTGREENLWACQAEQGDTDCGHKEDAGVICSEMRAVRLTGGLDRCSGKVEIHRNGSWGTVCDHCWNKVLASMVCTMLQCGASPQKISQFDPPLIHNNGTLWFYSCASTEQNLWQCRELINRTHLCTGSKASGVVCNGSLGLFIPTTANATVITSWQTEATPTVPADEPFFSMNTVLLSIMTLSVLVFVFLITNTVLCCHYKKKHAFLLEQSRHNSQAASRHHNNYTASVDLVKVTPHQSQTEVPPTPRYLWTQLSSADSTSVDTDYEQYDPCNDPSVLLSTFKNSQRHRTDKNPLMTRPSGLDSLFEEGPELTNEASGAVGSYNVEPENARESMISAGSFDSSSTSSGENYENLPNYDMVAPDPGEGHSSDIMGSFDPSRLNTNNQLIYRQTSNLSSGDEDEGPVYTPVSPDECEDFEY